MPSAPAASAALNEANGCFGDRLERVDQIGSVSPEMDDLHPAADQVLRLTDRTEDRCQQRNVRIDQFTRATDRSQVGAERPCVWIERLDPTPVGGNTDRTRNVVAGTFGVPAVHCTTSPIFDTETAGRCELHKIPVVVRLKCCNRLRQLFRILVIDREMTPQRNRRAINRLTTKSGGKPLTARHRHGAPLSMVWNVWDEACGATVPRGGAPA
jgi:hypothetical protein